MEGSSCGLPVRGRLSFWRQRHYNYIRGRGVAILQGLVRLFIILSPLKEISSRSLEQFYGVLHINGLTTDWVL